MVAGAAATAAPTAAGTAITAVPIAAGTMAMAKAPNGSGRSATAAAGAPGGGARSLHGPCYHIFILFFAVNLHLYLLSGFNVPTKLAQHYAKSLGSTAQLRLSKLWAEALWPPEPYVRAQLGCLTLGLWAERWEALVRNSTWFSANEICFTRFTGWWQTPQTSATL